MMVPVGVGNQSIPKMRYRVIASSLGEYNSSMTSEVLCLLVTYTCEVIGNAFSVSVPNGDRVPDLLEEVNEKASPLIDGKHLAADALTPWKPHSFFPAHPPAHLARHVNDLFLNDEDKCAASRLENGVTLDESFADPLPSKYVHVVVQLPPEDPIPGLLSPTSVSTSSGLCLCDA